MDCKYFGRHLDDQGNTKDADTEVNNFDNIGPILVKTLREWLLIFKLSQRSIEDC